MLHAELRCGSSRARSGSLWQLAVQPAAYSRLQSTLSTMLIDNYQRTLKWLAVLLVILHADVDSRMVQGGFSVRSVFHALQHCNLHLTYLDAGDTLVYASGAAY